MKSTQASKSPSAQRRTHAFQWQIKIEAVRHTDLLGKEAMEGTSSSDLGCSIKPIGARLVPWTAE